MTYEELVARIRDWLEVDETTFNENVDVFIKNAEEEINRKVEFPASRKVESLTLRTGSAYLDLPQDFVAINSVGVFLPSGELKWLDMKDEAWLREVYPNPNRRGVPRFFQQVEESRLQVAPSPDIDYEIEFGYYHNPPSVVEAGETYISKNAENALLYSSLLQAAIFLKLDEDIIAAYTTKRDEAMNDIVTLGMGRLRADMKRSS